MALQHGRVIPSHDMLPHGFRTQFCLDCLHSRDILKKKNMATEYSKNYSQKAF